jgi:hypothetical protein
MNTKKRKNVPFKDKALVKQRVAYHEAGYVTVSDIPKYRNDFTNYSEELKDLMDFDGSGELQDIYSFHYQSFFMYKCAHILLQRPVWKAVEAVAELLVKESILTDAKVMRTCKKIWNFELVADHLRKIYIGHNIPTTKKV